MIFFEKELKKIMRSGDILKEQRYAGRVCYGVIDGDLRARIEFVTTTTRDHYDGIKVTILNRTEGTVDSLLLRFADLFGKKEVSNPNFKNGVSPHIWRYSSNSEYDWYVYEPTDKDYKLLADQIREYLDVFR